MAISQNINDLEKNKFTSTVGDETAVRVIPFSGTDINPLAKFVEAIYSDGNTIVTYNYYESASRATLYNTITTTFSVPQDTTFVSAAWS